MSIYAVTVSHCNPEMLAHGLIKARQTMRCFLDVSRWVIVDHHWPIKKYLTSTCVGKLAALVDGEVIRPDKNLGGVGGANLAFDYLELKDDDLVIGYDPDSNPVTPGWDDALIQVMVNDRSLPYLSLMHKHVLNNRKWQIRDVNGYRVASDTAPEMFNITIWRGSTIKNGLPGAHLMWGGLESFLWSQGKMGAYLIDYLEDVPPLHHPQEYNDWKQHHHSGRFKGNFNEYIEMLKLNE